ncbi:MAG: hypothetical protein B0D96_05915 [Candidatus Sedimenticola endophacoides]|nr:MAG: hypothetical protein B0D94_07100 [Candidatus Sedimenticola endophacoides]OQX35783.1 MAG: hypothetical protein B0D96_05915 [Candidatus Sedimenticola endophacoides]OQX42288.1 MAG: hypothetical protein B0D89_01540 [Candidatus Sedimenticola endophacoides]
MFHLDESQIENFHDPEKNCGAGWSSVTLGPTGELRPCPMFEERYLTLGNLVEHSLEDVLRDSSDRFRYLTTIETPSPESCGGCVNSSLCMGCIARPVTVNRGDFSECGWGRKTGIMRFVEAP